ncbi:hypothetical protein ACFQLX_19385 [Streptomyces polyrhachis]|uniref:CofH/MqnC-like C-terminal domain-containing protein n=1 Tax=Streptomyces polyrhachis TaxID=1282885 RepID=A0ABW2GJJ1_9ACTN
MDAGLKRELQERVRAGERLGREDGIALYGSDDLAWLGGLAHEVRRGKHGDAAYFGAGETGSAAGVEELRYGYGEEPGALVDGLLRLRELQERTGALQVVTPLCEAPGTPERAVTGAEVLKTFALARLLLDNVSHLRVSWTAHGAQTAQLVLQHGADDIDGTAGADGEQLTREDLVELIRDAGLRPVERDARYEVVREYEGPDPALRESPQPMRL